MEVGLCPRGEKKILHSRLEIYLGEDLKEISKIVYTCIETNCITTQTGQQLSIYSRR